MKMPEQGWTTNPFQRTDMDELESHRRWRKWSFGWRTLGPSTILAGSLALSLVIYFGLLGSAFVEIVAAWTAQGTGYLLNLLGASTTVDGAIVSSDSFALIIVAECTALGPLVMFTGAVVAYPTSHAAKLKGLLLGLAVLTAVNLVRIVSLFWIGSAHPQYLDVAHLLVWQTAIILFAIVLWLVWWERIAGVRNS